MSKITIRAFWGHECQPGKYEFDTPAEAAAFCMGVAAGDGWAKHYLTDGTGETWIVQEETVCDGWVNNWSDPSDSGELQPQTFDSYEAAEEELTDFLEEIDEAIKRGDMTGGYNRDQYRIIPVDLEN